MAYYRGAARPRYTAAQRAAARAELARMESAAAWRHGVGQLTDAQYAAELARLEVERAAAVRRGIL